MKLNMTYRIWAGFMAVVCAIGFVNSVLESAHMANQFAYLFGAAIPTVPMVLAGGYALFANDPQLARSLGLWGNGINVVVYSILTLVVITAGMTSLVWFIAPFGIGHAIAWNYLRGLKDA